MANQTSKLIYKSIESLLFEVTLVLLIDFAEGI